MKYINEKILRKLGIDWPSLLDVIADATYLLGENMVSQPVKPYLRFNDPVNRIIAMPAYVGGKFNAAGIKWIASFPGNVAHSIKRAHSVVILNDTATGVPTTMINTALISGIRTASVSGFVLKKYIAHNETAAFTAGIIGFGPIGQLHLQMLNSCFNKKISQIFIYDINDIDPSLIDKYNAGSNISICTSWEEVFQRSDLFITCTVSKERYIHLAPKAGGVYMNVSLRDFTAGFLKQVDVNMVDDWEEVCRENTDIENAHNLFGLNNQDVLKITDILCPGSLAGMSNKSFMFNPMGMAIYDISVARYYSDLAISKGCFIELED